MMEEIGTPYENIAVNMQAGKENTEESVKQAFGVALRLCEAGRCRTGENGRQS
jgi:hypothetical protein